MKYLSSHIEKRNLVPFVWIGLLMLILVGCTRPFFWMDDDVPGTFRMDAILEWEGQPYSLGMETEDHMNHPLRLDNLQMYISEVALRNEQGEWEKGDQVHLLDFNVQNQRILDAFPPGMYDAIRFGMGLPSELNADIDPASYPNDHPLSVVGSAGMFWTWASGYVFVKYEGKYALQAGDPLIEPLSYHCGTDDSFRTVTWELEQPLEIRRQTLTTTELVFDASNVLLGEADSIDIVMDPVTHNSEGTILGGRLMDLMVNAWTIR